MKKYKIVVTEQDLATLEGLLDIYNSPGTYKSSILDRGVDSLQKAIDSKKETTTTVTTATNRDE